MEQLLPGFDTWDDPPYDAGESLFDDSNMLPFDTMSFG